MTLSVITELYFFEKQLFSAIKRQKEYQILTMIFLLLRQSQCLSWNFCRLHMPKKRHLGLMPNQYTKSLLIYHSICNISQALETALYRKVVTPKSINNFIVYAQQWLTLYFLLSSIWSIRVYPFISVWMNIDCDYNFEHCENFFEDFRLTLWKGSSSSVLLTAWVCRTRYSSKTRVKVAIYIDSSWAKLTLLITFVKIFAYFLFTRICFNKLIIAIRIDERIKYNETSF